MILVHERDAEAEKIGPPHKRVIRHLAAPWNVGTKNVWIGTSSIDPGYSSNEHSHADQEEIFYCVSGSGRIKVDGEEARVEAGDLVYVPPGGKHQLINDGKVVFKVLAVVSPPFIPEKFKKDHQLS
jgi:mannose-6-phosphate isomerase-like protein (cupin superfamily)